MISQKWKTHFVFLPQLFLAMKDKFIQNSLSQLTTKIYFGYPRRGKFSFRSSWLLLKRQFIGYSKSDKLCFLLEITSSDSCIYVRKQLLYSNCHQKSKQNPNSLKYWNTILNFYIWTINFSGSWQYCFLSCLNDSTVVEVLDTDSTNRTGPKPCQRLFGQITLSLLGNMFLLPFTGGI